jgi:tetratricopeptide (TPR) repeat protein
MCFGFRLLLPMVGFWLATVLTCSAQTVSAKAEFDLGVSAYKQAKYEEAIAHFRQAVLLDATFASAHLHLASAYAQQYIPGVDTPENNQMGQQAIVQFEQVLGLEPDWRRALLRRAGGAIHGPLIGLPSLLGR